MANIGSAFLGDLQAKRIRHLSSPATTLSPPISPPATGVSGFQSLSSPMEPLPKSEPESETESNDEQPLKDEHVQVGKTTIDPMLAVELRLRWLEALVLGLNAGTTKTKGGRIKEQETVARLAEDVQKRLNKIVEGNEGLKRFMQSYDQHAQYLTPSFALSGILDVSLPVTPTEESVNQHNLAASMLPVYENMNPAELEAYLTEMEPDIRAADRDMQEIEALVKRGVTGAGKLADYEVLQPRLVKLIKEHEEDVKLAKQLEKRVAKLVQKHATHVDTLSELFVAWDEALVEAENRTILLEKESRGRERLGLIP